MAKIDRTKGSISVPRAGTLPGSLGQGPGLAAVEGGQKAVSMGGQILDAAMQANEKFFAEAKTARKNASYAQAYNSAILQFNQKASPILMNPFDESGQPLMERLPGELGKIGQETLTEILEGIDDPEVKSKVTNAFTNYYTQQQIGSYGMARSQSIDFSRAEVTKAIENIKNQASQEGVEKTGLYDSQVLELLENSGGAFTEQEKQKIHQQYVTDTRVNAMRNLMKTNPEMAQQILADIKPEEIGISIETLTGLQEESNAYVKQKQTQQETQQKAQEQKLNKEQQLLYDHLENMVVEDKIGEADIYQFKDKLPIAKFTDLLEKTRRHNNKKIEKLELLNNITNSINNQEFLNEKYTPEQINTHYRERIAQETAQSGKAPSLTVRAQYVKGYKSEVSLFTKEIQNSLLDGDVKQVADAIQALDYLSEKQSSYTMQNMSEQARIVYSKVSSKLSSTNVSTPLSGVSLQQVISNAQEEAKGIKNDVKLEREIEFKAIDKYKDKNIKKTTEKLLDKFLDPGIFSSMGDVQPGTSRVVKDLLMEGYIKTGTEEGAEKYAISYLQGSYGVSEMGSKNRAMLLPPEKALDASAEDIQEYIASTLDLNNADNVPLNEDGTIDASKIILENAGESVRNLKGNPQYYLVNEENGEEITLGGGRYFYEADPNDIKTMKREQAVEAVDIERSELERRNLDFQPDEAEIGSGPVGPMITEEASPSEDTIPAEKSAPGNDVEGPKAGSQLIQGLKTSGADLEVQRQTIIKNLSSEPLKYQGNPQPSKARKSLPHSIPDNVSPTHYHVAGSLRGLNETANNRELHDFMKKYGGFEIDPKKTAWCAAFINSVLQSKGIRGTGKLNAKSFLNWGKAVSRQNIQPGDVVIFNRGNQPWMGHVGFFVGYTPDGKRMRILGGNQGGSSAGGGGVNIWNYPVNRVAGIRRP